MQLTDQDLQEFSEIWKEEFKETLTPAEARQRASQLLDLFALVAKPLPPETSKGLPPEPLPPP